MINIDEPSFKICKEKKRTRKVYRFVQTQNVSWRFRKRIQRAGVIPFFIDNRKMFFILGLDKAFEEWTDFGGSSKAHETGYETAMREMREETLGVLQTYLSDQPSYTVIEPYMAVLFYPVNLQLSQFVDVKENYDFVVRNTPSPENSSIEVFNIQELTELVKGVEIKGATMYNVVSRHLAKKIIDIQHWASPSVHSPEKK